MAAPSLEMRALMSAGYAGALLLQSPEPPFSFAWSLDSRGAWDGLSCCTRGRLSVAVSVRSLWARRRRCRKVRCIEVVLAGNTYEHERQNTAEHSQRRSHPMLRRGLADGRRLASLRRSPPGVSEDRSEIDYAATLVDGGGLCPKQSHAGPEPCAQSGLEPARHWRLAEGLFLPAWFHSSR